MSSTTIQPADRVEVGSIVNGVEVVRVEPVESGLSNEKRPMFYKRVKRLWLADGTSVYACTECSATDDTEGKIRGHIRRVHGTATPGRKPKDGGLAVRAVPDDVTVGELHAAWRQNQELTATVERQAAELMEVKSQLRKAKKEIASIRDFFSRDE